MPTIGDLAHSVQHFYGETFRLSDSYCHFLAYYPGLQENYPGWAARVRAEHRIELLDAGQVDELRQQEALGAGSSRAQRLLGIVKWTGSFIPGVSVPVGQAAQVVDVVTQSIIIIDRMIEFEEVARKMATTWAEASQVLGARALPAPDWTELVATDFPERVERKGWLDWLIPPSTQIHLEAVAHSVVKVASEGWTWLETADDVAFAMEHLRRGFDATDPLTQADMQHRVAQATQRIVVKGDGFVKAAAHFVEQHGGIGVSATAIMGKLSVN